MSTHCRRSRGPVLEFPGHRFSSLSGGRCGGAFASPAKRESSDLEWHQHNRRGASTPIRVHITGSSKAPAVRFSLGRRPASAAAVDGTAAFSSSSSHSCVGFPAPPARRTCTCSPTNHPGSFRCSLHKRHHPVGGGAALSTSLRLKMRRSAMTNSLVRIGTVEGDLVKRALAAVIRPSSHQQRRRADFRPRPSRLSVMSQA